MPVVEALRSGAQVVIPQPAPLGGALVEETSLISRWLAQPGIRIVCATESFASPRLSAGPWLQWSSAARAARYAAAAVLGESELIGEPDPVLEQPRRRAGVDGLGSSGQPLLPGRQPFGVAG